VRGERHERQRALGLSPREWQLTPRDAHAPPWEAVREREWEAERMAVYAAQVDRLDQIVGKILVALDDLGDGVRESTLVLFLSDNGAAEEHLPPNVGAQMPAHAPDGKPLRKGNVPGIMPGGGDTYMSYDLPWANVSNAPFRRYKHWVHEGGIATPLIASWPGVIPAGGAAHAACHVIDLMPTCLAAAGARYPAEFGGRAVTPVEGEDVLPLLKGQRWARERALCWEHEGNRAVRLANRKLVSAHPGAWELYDMDEDRTELRDLAAGDAPRVAHLAGLYEEWAERCGVRPWPEMLARGAKAPRPRPAPTAASRMPL
jgi:arylsulfatase